VEFDAGGTCCRSFVFPEVASAGNVKFAWDDNTQPQLARHQVHYRSGSRQYNTQVDVGNVVLALGSPNAVPDGGSTAVLIGFALAGLAVLARKLD
jgi:hypothetical protein